MIRILNVPHYCCQWNTIDIATLEKLTISKLRCIYIYDIGFLSIYHEKTTLGKRHAMSCKNRRIQPALQLQVSQNRPLVAGRVWSMIISCSMSRKLIVSTSYAFGLVWKRAPFKSLKTYWFRRNCPIQVAVFWLHTTSSFRNTHLHQFGKPVQNHPQVITFLWVVQPSPTGRLIRVGKNDHTFISIINLHSENHSWQLYLEVSWRVPRNHPIMGFSLTKT